jgi:NADPH2:quinone reductase
MRAVVARAFGPPESFAIEALPTPEPGPGQVRVAIRAAGVSFVDALVASGGYQLKPALPFTPGSECAGEVEAVGDGVTTLMVGDRVAASAFGGALAEQAVVSARACLPIPEEMSFEEASVFRVSYATAYHGLVDRGRLQPGETVLVLGAGGAVGVAAVEVAKALGARVIASASSDAKRDLARQRGADDVVDSRAGDWRDRIKALTDGRGVDIVVDPVGGPASEPAFRALAWEGRHLVIGFVAGIPKLAANLPLLKSAQIVGVDIRQFGERSPDRAAENMARLFELYRAGLLKPSIGLALPLDRFAEALRAAAEGSAPGRIVIRPKA